MRALNNPVEAGMRILVLLNEVYPDPLDVGHLVFCDHALLHSADLGGPPSIHPRLPANPGELGIKRQLVEAGLQVMIRAGLVEIVVSPSGITYRATEQSAGFIDILEAGYVQELKGRVNWVANEFAHLSANRLRSRMKEFFSQWSEEFFNNEDPTETEGPPQ